MSAVRRSREKRKRSLATLSAQEFMRYSSSEDDEDTLDVGSKSLVKKPRTMVAKGGKPIATGARRREVASKACKMSLQRQETRLKERNNESDQTEETEEEEEEEEGVLEPRPLEVTSYRQKATATREDPSSDAQEADEEEEEEGEELEEEEEAGLEDEGEVKKRRVTLVMVKRWASSLTKTHSVHMLRKLCGSLHDAIAGLLPQDGQSDSTLPATVPASSEVFNALVLACFRCVPDALLHHLPPPDTPRGKGPLLPSSQRAWRRVRGTVRQYLGDLLDLIGRLQSSVMQCLVLKQLQSVASYCVCFPKLLKKWTGQLVECWCAGDSHTQVTAFLCLRRLVLLQPHPALHLLLKKMYLAFVRNCKFPSAAGLASLTFMLKSLVELLAIDPPTSYQHGFVYIRQLAIHLRTALTSGKKDCQQAVYNWQFVYCLKLWGVVLCEVSDHTLHPLLYPLVQVIISTIQLQPSAKYHPLQLHLLKVLLQLADKTSIYIPLAPFLLEILEEHGVENKKKLAGGKAGDLSLVLRASSTQLNTRGFKTALVNEAFQLLLQYFVQHSHFISFPELCFPTLVRLKAVSKSTKYSWLRAQLKQVIEKVDEISSATTRERLKVTFSPKDYDQVTSWENQRKGRETGLSKFLVTWTKINSVVADTEASNTREDHKEIKKTKTTPTIDLIDLATPIKDDGSRDKNISSDGESDIVQDLNFSDSD